MITLRFPVHSHHRAARIARTAVAVAAVALVDVGFAPAPNAARSATPAVTRSVASSGVRSAVRGAALARSPGAELVQRMHDRYAGRWFRTITFVQRTTMTPANAPERVMTWYEAALVPNRLRIDFGDPAEGNGALFIGDSTYRFAKGQLVRATPNGNPLILFVMALYAQPVETTLAELAREHVDLTATRADTVDGRAVIVVGTASHGDLATPQFWVDAERLVPTRVILAEPPSPSDSAARTLDVAFDKWIPMGGGWLATDVHIRVGGALVQREEYSDCRANVELAPALFDPAQWRTAPHWLGKGR